MHGSICLDYIPIEKPLRLMSYLSREIKPNVWTTVFSHLTKPFALFSKTPAFESFRVILTIKIQSPWIVSFSQLLFHNFIQNYTLSRISQALQYVGVEDKTGEKGVRVLLRSRLIDWACAMEDVRCMEYATKVFQNWVDSSPENNPWAELNNE